MTEQEFREILKIVFNEIDSRYVGYDIESMKLAIAVRLNNQFKELDRYDVIADVKDEARSVTYDSNVCLSVAEYEINKYNNSTDMCKYSPFYNFRAVLHK